MTSLLFAALTPLDGLPHWTYPDTEVSTNITWRFADPNASSFCLDLTASVTPTNAIAVAFGTDADHDGSLSLDETCVTVGWDCGVAFARGDLPADADDTEAPGDLPETRERHLIWLLHGRPPTWDLFRVTVRGIDTPAVLVRTGTIAAGLTLRIK